MYVASIQIASCATNSLKDACIMVASYIAVLQQAKLTKVFEDGFTPTVMGMPVSKPEPLVEYNSMGAPGVNNGYAFSHVPLDVDIGTAV